MWYSCGISIYFSLITKYADQNCKKITWPFYKETSYAMCYDKYSRTVGTKIIRALEIVSIKKLIFNAVV